MPFDYPHLASQLFDTPLLMEPRKLEQVIDVLKPRLEGKASDLQMQANVAEREEGNRREPYARVGNIAVIPVMGSLVHRHSFVTAASGLSSYPDIAGAVEAAIMDPKVEGIALEIDSGGGAVSGCFDCADEIARMRGEKPIWALVNEHAFSAAYAIASAADRIVMPETAGVGSIGVIMAHVDESARLKQQGIKVNYIFAGAHKANANGAEPLSDDARAELQRMVDATYGVFVRRVAENRGMSEQAVRDTEAGIYDASRAMESGLADDIMSFSEALEALSNDAAGGGVTFIRSSSNSKERKVTMSIDEQQDAPAAKNEAEQEPTAQATAPDQEAKESAGEALPTSGEAEFQNAIATALQADRERAATIIKQSVALKISGDALVQNLIKDGIALADASAKLIDRAAEAAPTADIQSANAGGEQSIANLPLEERCKAEWERDPKLRAEFGEKYSRYLAYAKRESKKAAA